MAAPAAPAPRPASRPAPTPTPTATRPAPSAAAPPNSNRPPSVPATTPKPSKLGAVTVGVKPIAWRFFFWGTRGVGKSTLAADIPGAIFLDLDQGSEHLPVARYPLGHEPSYQDVLDAVDDLLTAPHDYKALVVDEVGRLEALIWRHIVATSPADKHGDRPTNIEEVGGGFQKGYVVAEQEWRRLVDRFDTLRVKRGMHIVLLGHGVIATTKNPNGENYDRHAPQINPKAAAVVAGNADVVGFLTFDDIAKRAGRKTIGVTGRRVCHLEHTATWDAKSRLPLPAMLDIPAESPWSPFAAAIEDMAHATPEGLRKSLAAELERLGAEFVSETGDRVSAAAVTAAIAKAGANVGDLHRFLQRLRQSSPAPIDTTDNPTE